MITTDKHVHSLPSASLSPAGRGHYATHSPTQQRTDTA